MFSPKLYLDGFDWIANLLNYQCRLTPGRGNHFMLVLESETPFPEDAVRALLKRLDPLLPMLNGSIRRHLLHLAPYWQPGKPLPLVFTTEELLFPSDFPLAVERFANRPLPRGQALAVHALSQPKGRSALIFKFSHLLFDGRGAELLLEQLRHGKNPQTEEHPGLASPMLNEWEKQFSCGRQIQQRLLEIQKTGPTAVRHACDTASSAYRVISLTEEETDSLRQRSDRDAGPFMLTPYLLALTAKGYDRLIPHEQEEEHFLIPISIARDGDCGSPRSAGVNNVRIGWHHLEEQTFIAESRIWREVFPSVSGDVPAVIHQRHQKVMSSGKDKRAFHDHLRHARAGTHPCFSCIEGLHDIVVIRCIPVIRVCRIDRDASGCLECMFFNLMGSEVIAGIYLPDVDPFPDRASPVQTVEIFQRAGSNQKIFSRSERRIDVFIAEGIVVFDSFFVQPF